MSEELSFVGKISILGQVFSLTEEEREVVCPSYIEADWCSEEECKKEVVRSLSLTGYLLDPHTAVAVAVARRCRRTKVRHQDICIYKAYALLHK